MGRITANMVRNFASQSILTGNSREALVKAIAQGAAETAFLGTCGIIDGLMDGVEEPDDSDTPRTDSPTERSQEERLHDIFNSLHEDVETTTTPQEHIFFGGDDTPPLKPIFHGEADEGASNYSSFFGETTGGDTPWEGLDELLRTSDIGCAYHAQYPLDPLETFYQGDSLDYAFFSTLSESTQRLRQWDQDNPETAQNIRLGLDVAGQGLRAGAYWAAMVQGGAMGAKVGGVFGPWGSGIGGLVGGLGGAIAVYTTEEVVGAAINDGIDTLAEKAEKAGRMPWEGEQFKQSVFLSAEGIGVGLMAVGGKRVALKGRRPMVRSTTSPLSIPLEKGYHVRMVEGQIVLARNPGRAADLPPLRYTQGEIVNLWKPGKELASGVPPLHKNALAYVGSFAAGGRN